MMRASTEWRTQGLFLHVETPLHWRRLTPGRILSSLAPAPDYNVRASRRGDLLAVTASLPPSKPTCERRLDWLWERLQRAAAALASGGPPSCLPPTLGGAPGLDDVRAVAEGRGWAVSERDDGLQLSPPDRGPRIPLRVCDADGDAWLCARLPSPAPRPAPDAVRAAVACAVLGLNARFAFGRLRATDETRLEWAVEGRVPGAGRDEEEIEFALEGVRHAAREAAGILECLRDEAVAREYAAARRLTHA